MLLVVASLTITVLSLGLPLTLLQVYDRIIPNQSLSTTGMLVAGVATAIVLEAILRAARSYLTGLEGVYFETRVANEMFDRLLHADMAELDRVGSGEHMERFNAVASLRELFAGQPIIAALDLLFAGVYIVLYWYLGGSLVVVPLLVIAITLLLTALCSSRLYQSARRHARSEENYSDFLISVLSAFQTVKALAAESRLSRRNEQLQRVRTVARMDFEQWTARVGHIVASMSQVGLIFTVAFGATRVIDGQLTVGGLGACTLLIGRAMQPLQSALSFWSRLQSMRVASDKVRKALRMPLTDSVHERGAVGEDVARLEGRIELREVSMSLAEDAPPIILRASMVVEPGEVVAVAGPNGCGKSLLLGLIRGLTRPTSGQVLLDGRVIQSYSHESLARHVGYLPQSESLFAGTILENMSGFDSQLHEAAYAAARQLGIYEEINALPNGFSTQLGHHENVIFPRGLIQRIAIARALARDPSILLFDEAHSAVDEASDEYLKKIIQQQRGKRTLILVSHRPSYLWLADRVHHLSEGRLEEEGFASARSGSNK